MSRKRPERPELAGLLGKSAELIGPAGGPGPQRLAVTALRPAPGQPRRLFDDAATERLAASIREHGVLQPLLVRPVGDGHEIVAGERRWRAAQLAGLSEVPVLIRELTDAQARAAALIENLQREDLNVIDEVDAKVELVALELGVGGEEARARLMQLLREEPGEEHRRLTALFAPLGESWESFAKNKLRIYRWPTGLVEALRGGLPLTLAAAIAAAPEEHHPGLIAQAQAGATRAELRELIGRLQPRAEAAKATGAAQAPQVARRLASRRWVASLPDADRRALEKWLARMPDALRAALADTD